MKYQGIVIDNMDWVETSRLFDTKEEAEEWVQATSKSNNNSMLALPWTKDSGYVIEVEDGAPENLINHNED